MPPCHRVELPYAAEIAALCALEYRRTGQDEEAEFIIRKALQDFVCTPNLHYLAAGLALASGDPDAAIGHYKRCLAFREQILVVPIQEGVTSYVSITGIAQAYLQKGLIDKARRLLEQSIRLAPSYEISTLILSRLHIERGDPNAALNVLTTFLGEHPESAGACQQTAAIMKELGFKKEADGMANQAIYLLESHSLTVEANKVRETILLQSE
jgi:tetratricopeptide (TPR) repeat protein